MSGALLKVTKAIKAVVFFASFAFVSSVNAQPIAEEASLQKLHDGPPELFTVPCHSTAFRGMTNVSCFSFGNIMLPTTQIIVTHSSKFQTTEHLIEELRGSADQVFGLKKVVAEESFVIPGAESVPAARGHYKTRQGTQLYWAASFRDHVILVRVSGKTKLKLETYSPEILKKVLFASKFTIPESQATQ